MSSTPRRSPVCPDVQRLFGAACAIGGAIGGVFGGEYLPDQAAGNLTVAVAIAAGAIAGGALSAAGVFALGRVLGWDRLRHGYAVFLILYASAIAGFTAFKASDGNRIIATAVAGMFALSLAFLYAWLSANAPGEPMERLSVKDQLRNWPVLCRIAALFSAVVIIVMGTRLALSQLPSLDHHGGKKIGDSYDIVFGGLTAALGVVFLMLTLFPKSNIWTRDLLKWRGDKDA